LSKKASNYKEMSKLLIPKFEKMRSVNRQIPKWTNQNSIYYRLPEYFKEKQREFLNTVPKPVHQKFPKTDYIVDTENDIK
jgi:hypothetical protein